MYYSGAVMVSARVFGHALPRASKLRSCASILAFSNTWRGSQADACRRKRSGQKWARQWRRPGTWASVRSLPVDLSFRTTVSASDLNLRRMKRSRCFPAGLVRVRVGSRLGWGSGSGWGRRDTVHCSAVVDVVVDFPHIVEVTVPCHTIT